MALLLTKPVVSLSKSQMEAVIKSAGISGDVVYDRHADNTPGFWLRITESLKYDQVATLHEIGYRLGAITLDATGDVDEPPEEGCLVMEIIPVRDVVEVSK